MTLQDRSLAIRHIGSGHRTSTMSKHLEGKCMAADRLLRASTFLLAFTLTACAHLGPKTVSVDRYDYSTAIAESWKEQTLLNIVKIRYVDVPVFVDVASIVAGYSLQTGVNVGGTVSSQGAIQGNYGSFGGQGIYTDRPTITYVPMTGDKFLRGLVTPIDPRNIFFMIQAGSPADFLLALTVESINGVRNRSTLGGQVRLADPDFVRAVTLLRDVQADGGVGMRVEDAAPEAGNAVLFFRREDLAPETKAKAEEIRRLFHLAPDQSKFALIYSPVRGADDQLAVNTRSMLQILQAFASYVEVPEKDLRENHAAPQFEREPDHEVGRIRSGTSKPDDAFVAVRYRDSWFWVDQSDWQAKRALGSVILLFTMMESGGAEKLPLVTIPAQ